MSALPGPVGSAAAGAGRRGADDAPAALSKAGLAVPEQQQRRRRRRRRRGGGGGERPRKDEREHESAAEPSRQENAVGRPARQAPQWHWRTFPVFAAFVAGALVILIIAPETNTLVYTVLFFGFLGGAAFSMAHIFTRMVLDRRRR